MVPVPMVPVPMVPVPMVIVRVDARRGFAARLRSVFSEHDDRSEGGQRNQVQGAGQHRARGEEAR